MLGLYALINFFANTFVRYLLPPLFPEIADELQMTYMEIGLVWGAPSLGMVFFSLMGGIMGDRFGVKKTIAIFLPFVGLFAGLIGLCHKPMTLAIMAFLLGASSAFIIPNLSKGAAIGVSSAQLGRAQGLLLVAASLGVAIAPTICAAILRPVLGGWRNVMFLSSAIFLPISFFWVICVKKWDAKLISLISNHARTNPWESLGKVCKNRSTWYLAFVEFSVIGSFLAFSGLFPKILVDGGMEKYEAGLYVSIAFWGTIVFNAVGPMLSDRLGFRKPLIIIFLITYSIGLAGLGFFTENLLIFCLLVTALGYGCVLPIVRTVEIETFGVSRGGIVVGLMFTINRAAGWFFPLMVGRLIDQCGFHWPAFLVLSTMNFFAAMLSFRLKSFPFGVKSIKG